VRPVSLGIVEVGQHLEGRGALEQCQGLGQIAPEVGWRLSRGDAVQLAAVDQAAAPERAVDGAEDTVEAAAVQDAGGLFREPVRLTQLHPAEDAQAGKEPAAAIDLLQVTGDVERTKVLVHLGHEVGVLREGQRRHPDLYRPPAGSLHVAHRRVPGELAVNVQITLAPETLPRWRRYETFPASGGVWVGLSTPLGPFSMVTATTATPERDLSADTMR
jgi:hypothetical protein